MCVNKNAVLLEKAIHLYTSLPVFRAVSEEEEKYMEKWGIGLVNKSIETSTEELKGLIRYIFSRLGIAATKEML